MRNKVLALSLIVVSLATVVRAKDFNPGDLVIPSGLRAEVAAKDLNNPSMVAFDDQNRLIVAEADKVIRIESNGAKTVLADKSDFEDKMPVYSVGYHDKKVFIGHGDSISVLEQDGKVFHSIITGLPTGDGAGISKIIFKGTIMYFGVGSKNNSNIGGTPCQEIKTVATKQAKSETIKGDLKCNGSILRSYTDGNNLQMYAWGFNNNFGLETGPDDALYVSNENEQGDCIYKVSEGQWYGWPDFNCGAAVKTPVIANHPVKTPVDPFVKFEGHLGVGGFTFLPSNDWGKTTDLLVPEGSKVVRIDTIDGSTTDFLKNKESQGFENIHDVVFDQNGALYLTDTNAVWRISRVNQANPQSSFYQKFGLSPFMSVIQLIVLGLLVWFLARKGDLFRGWKKGLTYGLTAAGYIFVFTVVFGVIAYRVPWFGAMQLFDVLTFNSDILRFSIQHFLIGIVIFTLLTVLLTELFVAVLRTENTYKAVAAAVVFGLFAWSIVQYLILPHYTPTTVSRSYPIGAFTLTFLAYGIILGYLFAIHDKSKS